jgi:AraC-like DNA-binding protein
MYHVGIPHPLLQPYINVYWSLDLFASEETPYNIRVVVEGVADLIFDFGAIHDSTDLRDGRLMGRRNHSYLDAQRDYPMGIRLPGHLDLVAVHFRSGGLAAFLPMPMYEVTNQAIDIQWVWGEAIQTLEGQLYDAKATPATQWALLDAFFLKQLALPAPWQAARYAAKRLEAAGGQSAIGPIAQEMGYSIRTLDRYFRAVYGYGPKWYGRLLRFHRALHWLEQFPTHPLVDIAVACGFYDQSHLTREFSDLAALSPVAYRKEANETVIATF